MTIGKTFHCTSSRYYNLIAVGQFSVIVNGIAFTSGQITVKVLEHCFNLILIGEELLTSERNNYVGMIGCFGGILNCILIA